MYIVNQGEIDVSIAVNPGLTGKLGNVVYALPPSLRCLASARSSFSTRWFSSLTNTFGENWWRSRDGTRLAVGLTWQLDLVRTRQAARGLTQDCSNRSEPLKQTTLQMQHLKTSYDDLG